LLTAFRWTFTGEIGEGLGNLQRDQPAQLGNLLGLEPSVMFTTPSTLGHQMPLFGIIMITCLTAADWVSFACC
jgi:hypothetical protein